MDEVTVTKVIVTFLLWASKFACGVAPILIRGNMRGPNGGWWAKKLIGKNTQIPKNWILDFFLSVCSVQAGRSVLAVVYSCPQSHNLPPHVARRQVLYQDGSQEGGPLGGDCGEISYGRASNLYRLVNY